MSTPKLPMPTGPVPHGSIVAAADWIANNIATLPAPLHTINATQWHSLISNNWPWMPANWITECAVILANRHYNPNASS